MFISKLKVQYLLDELTIVVLELFSVSVFCFLYFSSGATPPSTPWSGLQWGDRLSTETLPPARTAGSSLGILWAEASIGLSSAPLLVGLWLCLIDLCLPRIHES